MDELNPLQKYERAINTLTQRISQLRRANPRPGWHVRTEISHLTTRRNTLAENMSKLKMAYLDEGIYQEQITTQGRAEYSAALIVARRAIERLEGLAPSEELKHDQ